MSKLKEKLTVATFLLLSISNCTYWPTANVILKDQFLNFFNSNKAGNLNIFAALLILPSTIDTTPGASIHLTSDNSWNATWIDVNDDSISDGIDLKGSGYPNILSLDLNEDGKPDALDTNGDGTPDYFLNTSTRGGVLRTHANGSGSPVFLILNESKEVLGFDTDGDGVPNDTLIAEILKDATKPNLTVTPDGGIFSSDTELTFQCSDDKSPGHVLFTVDTSVPSFNPLNGTVKHPANAKYKLTGNGDFTITGVCRDLNGNVSNRIIKNFTIDPNLPNVQVVSQSSKGVSINAGAISQSTTYWKSSKSGTYSLRGNSNSCNDGNILASGSVLADTQYSFQRLASDFAAEGIYYFRICVVSDSGRTVESNFSVYRDDTAPTVSASVGSGNYGSQPSPALNCSDVGGSGCNGIVYTLNSSGVAPDPVFNPVTGAITTGTAYGLTAITMPNLATTSLKFQARDSAGNVSAINLQTYVVDTDLPVITVNSFTSPFKGTNNPTISWKSNKAGSYQLRIDGSDCFTGTAFTVGAPNSNVVGTVAANVNRNSAMNKALFAEGDNTIRICFTTSFGVLGSVTRTLFKDSVNPVVSIVSPTGAGPFPSGTQIVLQCTDTNGSGCKNVGYYALDDGGSLIYNASGNVTSGNVYSGAISVPDGLLRFTYSANDMALNYAPASTITIQIGYPDAPNFMKATGNGNAAYIEWLPTASATSYSLYYDTAPGVNNSSTRIDGITNPYYTLTGLNPGTRYFFKLQSHSALGSSLLTTYEATAVTGSTPMGFNVSGNYADISAGQGGNSGYMPVARIDYTNQKLIVVSQNVANSYKPNVYICELDGSNCVYRDVSAGQATATLFAPTLEIDTRNQKLLVAGSNSGNSGNISLFRCDLDGTNCTHRDISGGAGASYGPSLLLDSIYKKLIVISKVNNFGFVYSRCDLDGTNCVGGFPSVLGGMGEYTREITAKLDPISQKIVIASRDGNNGDRLALIRCSLLVNNCTLTDVSASQASGSGFFPQIEVDVFNSKLLMTARDQTTGLLGLFRCDLDGTNCSFKDISSGVVVTAESHSTKIDPANGKLLVAASDNGNGRANLFRCDLDGTNATNIDVSLGMNSSGNTPSLVIDSWNARTAIVTRNPMNSMRLGLFIR